MDDEHAFADEWVQAWNAHDLDRILAHYADGVVLSSPAAAAVVPGSGGVVRGREALRRYWEAGLADRPGLRFELRHVLRGVGGVTLVYGDEQGRVVAETMRRDGAGKVDEVTVSYGR